MLDAYIHDGLRTPFGRHAGALAPVRPDDLLADVIRANTADECALLVDSLGMWLNNLMYAEMDLDGQFNDLLESLAASSSPVVLVSDEVGLGGVADNELAREFADKLGELNQRVAAAASDVYLVVSGVPVTVKTEH